MGTLADMNTHPLLFKVSAQFDQYTGTFFNEYEIFSKFSAIFRIIWPPCSKYVISYFTYVTISDEVKLVMLRMSSLVLTRLTQVVVVASCAFVSVSTQR